VGNTCSQRLNRQNTVGGQDFPALGTRAHDERVCARVRVRACVRACARVCVRASMHVRDSERECVCVCVRAFVCVRMCVTGWRRLQSATVAGGPPAPPLLPRRTTATIRVAYSATPS
jgi:hypothetical protein